MKNFLGIKKGMTKFYEGDKMIPVTVIEIPENTVFMSKKLDNKNLTRIGILKKKKMNKPEEGTYGKIGYSPKFFKDVWTEEEYETGKVFDISEFSEGDLLKITGVGKGKGFAGVVKRYGFAGGPRTHGQSDRERAPGSIGAGTDPGRVLPGKKMPGRMGGDTITVIKRKVINVGEDYVLVKGSLPGSNENLLRIEITRKNED